MRAIASLPYPTRRDLLRLLLKTKTTVSQLETIARGKKLDNETDIRKLERDISDHTGQPTRIRFNHRKKSGSITVDFFSLDEFDFLCEKLGYKPADDF
jgi:ParB family chromosome partitioning protein